MTRSSFARRTKAQHKGRPAPLCDLVSPERSIFVRALQYLAFLLTGRAPKTILIWSFKGYTSFEVWAANEPDDLIRCRRTVLCTSSLIDGRFWKILLSCPWIWAGIFDPRRSGDDRRLLCRKVHRLGTESKDSWFTDPVLEWIGSEDDFATEEFQMFGFLWTWSVSATICQWEFMYGRNRSRANRNQLWHNFSAHSYNQEKHRRFIWSKSAFHEGQSRGQKRKREDADDDDDRKKTRRRRKCVFDIYREELLAAKKEAGEKDKFTSVSFKEDLRKVWPAFDRTQHCSGLKRGKQRKQMRR